MLDSNYERAKQILIDHIDILHNMANALLAWETLDKFQIESIMMGVKIADPEVEVEPLADTEKRAIELGDEPNNGPEQDGIAM